MSDNLKSFFTAVTNDNSLQQELYRTNKIADVAILANQLGFSIQAVEVLQAQAGRVLAILEENTEDVQCLISGLKPKTGAQWGRGGGGFLDRAGYWLLELPELNSNTENAQQINRYIEKLRDSSLLKEQLLNAKTFNEAAIVFRTHGFNLAAADLLSYQAQKILALNLDQLEQLASQ